jgi:ubiquinone/menaquinone biosynthesis C-methylase UbiE
MESDPQPWHYGLIAKWWAEFNDAFRPHGVPYFQRYIERDGEPALDVACGTGRLLLPTSASASMSMGATSPRT